MHETIEYRTIAKAALNNYAILSNDINYLGKSDNVNYHVRTSAEEISYLLKIHSSHVRSSRAVIESEMIWLEALGKDLKHVIPAPVKNKEGEMVTSVPIADSEGECLFVTVYHWVDGDLLTRPLTKDETISLAKLVADMHKQSMNWTIPDHFDRPVYHIENLLSSHTQLIKHLHTLMSEDDLICLEQTVHKITSEINNQKMTKSTWGIIHSDLHESNYVLFNSEPRPIDFSNCGLGFYLFDIAEIFLHLSPDNQQAFITTYKNVHRLQEDYIKVIEAFFIWSIIRTFSFHTLDPGEHKNTADTLIWVINKYCKNYLEDKNFLLD